jgi:hypothetical protein
MAQTEDLGPVDMVVIGYPAGAPLTGEAVPILLDLVDRGIVRVLDARAVIKEQDGTFSGFDVADLDEDRVGSFGVFAGASSGMLTDNDIALVADEIEPGTAAVTIVYENRWAAPFVSAIRRNGGFLVASERIHAQDLLDTLEAAEAASSR